MAETTFQHLGFTRWPCQIQPTRESASIWAERHEVFNEFDRLFRSAARIRTSQIRVIWGWYGTGKTHALYHFMNRCSTSYPALFVTYCSSPNNPKLTFPDIYRELMAQNESVLEAVRECTIARRLRRPGEKRSASPHQWRDFEFASRAFAEGTGNEAELARSWLLGNWVHLNDLKRIGVSERIDSDRASVRAITEIQRLLQEERKGHIQWVLILDEFQNVLAARNHEELQMQINDLMNNNPEGLTVLLSCTMDDKDTLYSMLSPSIRNRFLASKGTLDIPPFSYDQALEFVRELFQIFRSQQPDAKLRANPWFPFSEAGVRKCIEKAERDVDLRLVPRGIMKVIDAVMRHYDEEILGGHIAVIDAAEVEKVFA